MSVADNEKRIGQLENRLGIIEDRILSRNGVVTQSLCRERHEQTEDAVKRCNDAVAQINARLWAILVGVALALAGVVVNLLTGGGVMR